MSTTQILSGRAATKSLVDLDGRARKEEDPNAPSYASYPTTSSSCLSCAFGGIITNARSRSQHIAGFFTWPTNPIRRERRTNMATRAERSLSYLRRDSAVAPPSPRQRASTTASSMAWQAPWPRLGVMGWAASPSSVTLPSPNARPTALGRRCPYAVSRPPPRPRGGPRPAGAQARDRFGEAELLEGLLGVGGEQQAGTDLPQLGRTLED